MTRVLVVEDEPQLVRALEINLRARRYDVDAAPDGETALTLAAANPPDAVLLDLGLPDMDGIDVMRTLRRWSRAPILVVSARSTSDEKVEALDAGADDYITKPFSMDELLARLRAATRRGDGGGPEPREPEPGSPARVSTPTFTLDLLAKKATRDGAPVRLTPTEWHLLEVLIRHRGRLVTQRQLLQEVWGPTYRTQSNYLRVYMAQLRRKLEADPSHPRYLVTAPGMGYRFEV
ncbi:MULTISPECIES: response regulator transcription factor [Streptomyces]|uniref:Response regulator transcription factor n=1 Tax=Streptomyces noboritoensis TaxID=67337 RepID=A0ABV6TJZ9_9ACTN|nr:response regulator transcription factor [Streptomyces melanogenes]GGP53829.1 DNA-binding response regulator [Streptomyces melanogenes]